MLVIDPERLTALCRELEPFGSLEVDEGRVVMVRSYLCNWETLGGTIARIRHGETVKVDRFPDGFKVQFFRLLATVLAGDDGPAADSAENERRA